MKTNARFSLAAPLALAVPLFAAPALGQTPAAPAPPSPFGPALITELKQVRDASLSSDYAYKRLAHLTENIGPRLSGSPQAQAAVEYVAAELRRLGLDVTLERTLVPHWVRGVETAELTQWPDAPPGTSQKVVLTALGGSAATPQNGLTADVVVVNNLDDLAALPAGAVKGKIVLFNNPFDKALAAGGFGLEAYLPARVVRSEGPPAAAKLGAAIALVRSVGDADYRIPHAGQTGFAPGATPIPAAAVAAEDAELIAHLAAQGPVRMRVTLTPQKLPDAVSYNVIADLKGREHPEQVVIVSGHLDSWDLGRGAIDDGAGVVVAMQAAATLKQLGIQPRRTLRVVAWMSEENGSAGAETYATEHAGQMGSHYAAIESDLGADHPLGFDLLGKPAILPLLAPVSTVLSSFSAGLSKMTDDTEADIDPLAQKGVPAFGLWQDSRYYFHYHHTPADTLDKVDPHHLAENAAVMATLATALCEMPGDLPR